VLGACRCIHKSMTDNRCVLMFGSVKQDITMAEFVRRFERPRLPVVLTGLCDPWPAAERWQLDRLLERFGDHKFKVQVPGDADACKSLSAQMVGPKL